MHLSTIKKAKDGKLFSNGDVHVYKRNGALRLTLKFKGRYKSITIKGGISRETLQAANDLIKVINADLAYNKFDSTLQKYRGNQFESSETKQPKSQSTLKDAWEHYKKTKKNRIALTTQKGLWRQIDKFLSDLPPKALDLDNINNLGNYALKIRSPSTLNRYFTALNTAISLLTGKEQKLKSQLPRLKKKPVEWFEPEEVKAILEAFQHDLYAPQNRLPHSFYYPYVAFLALTGCRPEEALALKWDDLLWTAKGCKVDISKAYSQGILRPTTKTDEARVIPLPENLSVLLRSLPGYDTKGLIFPGDEGGYLDHAGFRRRAWTKILTELVKAKKIARYLRPYCLRHSYVSNLHYEHGISLVKIAKLIGDRPETVIKKYTGLKDMEPEEMPILY